MSTFADSSLLVKLYVPEEGFGYARSLGDLVVSQAARVEVPAAFWRKYRTGVLTASQVGQLVMAFEADYYGTVTEEPRFAVVEVSDLILDVAAMLAGIHGLRAYDSIQLATAKAARSADPDCVTFAAYDTDLCKAAVGEGFQLIP